MVNFKTIASFLAGMMLVGFIMAAFYNYTSSSDQETCLEIAETTEQKLGCLNR